MWHEDLMGDVEKEHVMVRDRESLQQRDSE